MKNPCVSISVVHFAPKTIKMPVYKPPVVLRLALYGCKNRPFYHIVATRRERARNRGAFEQIGVFDPMPNDKNEKLVSFNMERVKYWISVGATPTRTVSILLGMAGILPLHPFSLLTAKRNREAKAAAAVKALADETETQANDT